MAASGAATIAALGGCESELDQALALHAASGTAEAAGLSLGEGDRRLLALHRAVTGRDPELIAACEGCGTESAATLRPEDLPPSAPRCARLGAGGGLREPTYADLRGLPAAGEEAAAELLRRCTVGSPERPAGAAELELVDDSLSGPMLIACAGCGAEIELPIDAERLALEGLQRHAREVDLEVHLLASAYGWELAAIEALPDERRQRLARFVAGAA